METINHEYYVSPEIAKMLKEAGFDWEVNHSYPNCESLDNSCSGYMEDLTFYHNLNDGKYSGMSAPTLDVAQRWLREVKNHHICISFLFANNHKYYVFINRPTKRGHLECDCGWVETEFDTYEEAQEAGIKKVLEIILEKGKL